MDHYRYDAGYEFYRWLETQPIELTADQLKEVFKAGLHATYGRELAQKGSGACEILGCYNPGLCQSGNVANRVVCRAHFAIFNGQ